MERANVNLPEYLYRYRQIETDFALDEIEAAVFHQEFYHASPLNWNDPFDLKPVYTTPTLRQAARDIRNLDPRRGKWSKSDVERVGGKTLTRAEYKQQTKKQRNPLFLTRAYVETAKRVVNGLPGRCVASCFSERADCMPMWAHYAGNHSGICLELKLDIQPALYPNEPFPLPVVYSSSRPHITFADLGKFTGRFSKPPTSEQDKQAVMNKLLFSKSLDWSYEHEWRTVLQDSGVPGYRYVRCLAVTRILFGLGSKNSAVASVAELVAGRVPLFRGKVSDRDFKIEFVPC